MDVPCALISGSGFMTTPWQCTVLAKASSTNLLLKEAAEKGAPEGTAIRADRQTAGRGRRGRVWESPPGNLYLSVLLRDLTLEECAKASFLFAVALLEALKEALPDETFFCKWPNDILDGEGRKLSGILLEAGQGWLVGGLGINILHKPDAAACLYQTAALSDFTTAPPTAEALAKGFLTALRKWLVVFRADGFAPIREAWLADAYGIGKTVHVRLPREEFSGLWESLNENGALSVRLADGTKRDVTAGDVFFGDMKG